MFEISLLCSQRVYLSVKIQVIQSYVTFDQFNVSSLNISINFLKNVLYWL